MKKLIILLCCVIAVGVVSSVLLTEHPEMQRTLPKTFDAQKSEPGEELPPEDPLEVSFSKNGTFYASDIEIELSCPDADAVIYYTDDGNDPDESSREYTSPIKLTAKKKAVATTIKAVAVKDGRRSASIALKSYVTGQKIDERFDDDTLVFILSSDEYNLYDYYNGIAVEGYLRDEFMREEYDGGEVKPTDPANYNIGGRESERDMFVEVYNSKGEQLIYQAAGTRVVGGYSRAVDQKSFRLIARNSYSEGNGKFKYPFFGIDTDAYGNYIDRYDRVTLRNGANDREFAGVRDELSMTLAQQSGFLDSQSVRPAAVFLNGEYYGYAWLHEAFSNDYLEMMYGGSKDNFRIVGAKELSVSGDDEQSVKDWEHVVEIAEKDLSVDLYFWEFCDLVDIDDLMLYYAMQIYTDNKDWPGNNFKAWRYYPSEGESVTSPYLDGKWRFLYFDAEFAWGLYGAGYRDNTLNDVITGHHMQGSSHILRGLLARKDMREKFANTVCELIGGAFAPDNVNAVLDSLIEKSDHEQMYALENGYQSEWANTYTFADSRQQIRDFAKMRPAVIKKHIAALFGYTGDTYSVEFTNPSGARTKLGSKVFEGTGRLSVDYFAENSVTLSTEPYDGFEFEYWEVNGTKYYTPTVVVDRKMTDASGKAEISLFLSRKETTGGIIVSELYSSGSDDWIEIYNPTQETVDLSGYHLSDDELKPDKWTLQSVTVPAGETVTIVCKNNNEESALGRHQTNFSLKTGETLYFTDKELNVISMLKVLDLEKGQSLTLGVDGKYHITTATEGIHIPLQ